MSLPGQTPAGFGLSPQQRRLWLSAGNAGVFCARAAVLVEGDLSPVRLRQAATTVCARHEILRTRFARTPWSKVPSQVIETAPLLDWRELAEGSADRLFDEGLDVPHALETGPLVTCTLLRQAAQRRVLLVRLPALCGDERSLAQFVVELARAYAGGAKPGAEPLQYPDFAAWQEELLAADDGNTELVRAYWAKRSVSGLAAMILPGELRPAEAFAPRAVAVPLGPSLVGELEALAESWSAPLPVLLLAAWEALLWHLIRSEGLVVGRLFDGRKYEDLGNALGLFARPLPVAGGCRGDLAFRELVQRVGEAEQEAEGWQEYGVGDAASEEAERFPYAFELADWPEPQEAGGVTFSLLRRSVCLERFKVKLACLRVAGALTSELCFDAGRLPFIEALRMAQRFTRLTADAVARPDVPVRDLAIATAEERHQVFVELNDSGTAPAREPVHHLFARQARQTPWAAALACEDERLTYAELEERSNRLARHLAKLGVGPEVTVALFCERSLEGIVGLLAVLKAGGAYLALDPAFPRERLAAMLEDARPAVVLAFGDLPEQPVPVIRLDAEWETVAQESGEDLGLPAAPPESLAYVLFTSGSTGRPKGVAVEHRQLASYVAAISERLGAPAGASFATLSTLAADLGHTMVFPSLCGGGCLHVITAERALEPEALAEYFDRHEIGCLKIVPTQLEALLGAVPPGRVLPRQRLVLGGEACGWELIDRLGPDGRGPLVFNHYGPTETTVGVLTAPLDRSAHCGRPARPPLGWPLAGNRVYVLDRALQPLPAGVPGELCIGGAQVARGYLGRPGSTAERFLPDPFAGEPGARLYRTGDLVRLAPGGALEFLGRVDQQVKIRGFRIEPGEIEAALSRHEAVREVAVVAREDSPGARRLVAYVVPQPETEPSGADWRLFLKDKLPEYMVPSAFVVLPALPLTPNGKLDRAALPAPETARREAGRSYAAPRTPAEEILARIWTRVLGVERVGIHDNFFTLGGDSILAIQVIGKARAAGLNLNPRDLFQHQSIAELAAAVGLLGGAAPSKAALAGPAPLTPIQRWFFEQEFEDPHHWNQALLLELRQRPDIALLAGALRHVAAHHDALRFRFEPGPEGRWHQVASAPSMESPVAWVDLSGLATSGEEAADAAAAGVQASLDLAAGRLLRAVLFDRGPAQPLRLLLVAHHLVVDGVSWRILLEDLDVAYRHLADGLPLPTLPRTTGFGDWARRLEDHARSGALEAERPHWQRVGRGVEPLPRDFLGGDNLCASARTLTVSLTAEETRSLLQEVTRAYRAELQEVILCALARTVGRWTCSLRVSVVVEGHGRDDVFAEIDVTRTVGWFTTHHPVVLAADWAAEPGQTLLEVKEQLRRVPGRGFGYGLLRYLCDGDGDFGPLPEISFNYLGQLDLSQPEESLFRLAWGAAGATKSPRSRRERPFQVGGQVLDGQLQLTWIYSESLHRRETVERLLGTFAAELRSFILGRSTAEDKAISTSDFPLAGLSHDQLERIARRVSLAGGGGDGA